MQCICGFCSTDKPQNQWTDTELKREIEHQNFHLLQQEISKWAARPEEQATFEARVSRK